MWVSAPAVEASAPAPAPPAFQVILPPKPTRPMLDLSRDGSGGIGGVIVVAPRLEPKWSRQLNLDPKGDFAKEAVPYLARPPHNECKIMGGVDSGPAGQAGPVGGIGCAYSFW